MARVSAGDHRGAVEDAEKAVDLGIPRHERLGLELTLWSRAIDSKILPEWMRDLRKAERLVQNGGTEEAAALYERGLRAFEADAERKPLVLSGAAVLIAVSHYNLACCYGRRGQAKQALDELRKAIDAGYRDFAHMERDEDLKLVREDPGWKTLFEGLNQRGYLGVEMRDGDGRVDVVRVVPGCAAEKAGLKAGDAILAVDQRAVSRGRELADVVAAHRAGDRVRLRIERAGEVMELDVVLGRRP